MTSTPRRREPSAARAPGRAARTWASVPPLAAARPRSARAPCPTAGARGSGTQVTADSRYYLDLEISRSIAIDALVTDCPNNGLCCFDGCADTCVDGPKPAPQTTTPYSAPPPPPPAVEPVEAESESQPEEVAVVHVSTVSVISACLRLATATPPPRCRWSSPPPSRPRPTCPRCTEPRPYNCQHCNL